MKINAQRVLDLRTDRCWSQDELALAAGLNLRTIQRIEREATASLQSKKALASALEVSFRDLDEEGFTSMKKYQYKTLEIDANEGFLTGLKKVTLPDLVPILNQQGEEGWQLVQILTPELAKGAWSAKTGNLLAVFKRECVE